MGLGAKVSEGAAVVLQPKVRAWVKPPLVQILVVVANIQRQKRAVCRLFCQLPPHQ